VKEYTKTITVQAVQWTGENLAEVDAFFEESGKHLCGHAPKGCWFCMDIETKRAWIEYDQDFHRDYKEVTP